MYARPPAMTPEHGNYDEKAPLTESLADCQSRVVACWEATIAPALFEEEDLPTEIENRTVLVAAHGNSIRGILKYLDGISDDEITKLESKRHRTHHPPTF